jgi:serralysin
LAYQNYNGVMLPESATRTAEVRGTWINETLYGGPGNDSLDGGGGVDTYYGGAGDDYYWGGPLVIERPGEGVDTIRVWSSMTLPDNVENLVVFGAGSYAAGNGMNNIVQGLDEDQTLYGGRGDDVLIGGPGNDVFIIVRGEGQDVIQDFQGGWGSGDALRLIGSSLLTFAQVKAAMTQVGADVKLDNGGEAILFRNTTVAQFQADDFQLGVNYAALGAPTFTEEFNSLSLVNPATGAGVWRPHLGYGGETGISSFTLPRNGEQQIYTSPQFQGQANAPLGLNPFAINNGVLTIKGEKVSADVSSKIWSYGYTSGLLTTQTSFTQKYGYFEIRADVPQGQGLWPAFWLLPERYSGQEIDVLEAIGSEPTLANTAVHGATGDQGKANFVPNAAGFHTYGVMWSASDLIYYIDGAEVWRTPTPSDMDQPMYMLVNLAVGGNWPGSPDASTPWPAEFKIDYVRAYALPSPGTPPVTPPPATGDQVLTAPHDYGSTLTGGAGNDTLNASRGADILSGGAGADRFVFKTLPWNPGRITDFAATADTLDVSALLVSAGYKGSDPVADGYLRLTSTGAGGTVVAYDSDGWASGVQWATTITTVDGIAPAALKARLVTGAIGATGQVLTASHDRGSVLTGSTGADTLNASRGADTLTGGAGADRFVFKALPWNAGHITDFTPGLDVLDVSALLTAAGYKGVDPVADGYLRYASNGAGGTLVQIDGDGWGAGVLWPTTVTTLDGVQPTAMTAGAAPTPGKVLAATSDVGAPLVGGAGADTLIASRGADTLTGGGAADTFVFNAPPWRAGHITDFTPSVDKLDLSDLLASAGYRGSSPIDDGYVRVVTDGAGSAKVLFDADGWGSGAPWPTIVTTLDGVAPESLRGSDWIFA